MTLSRTLQLILGCVVLGTGVALLLTPALGSDGFSTLVNGVSLAAGVSFAVANVVVSLGFVALAWTRGVRPGVGTLIQMVLVGVVATLVLGWLDQPEGWVARVAMLALAFPVTAVGIVLYLGSRLGAGPAEAAAQAFDPPVPFAWTYSAVQGGGALVGWQLGSAIGPGTVAVILLLGPATALTGRLLRMDLTRSGNDEAPGSARDPGASMS